MIAFELISDLAIPAIPEDTVAQALSMMSVYHVKHLPVVSNNILLGILSEEDATNHHPDTKIRDVKVGNIYSFVNKRDHIFEVLSKLAENRTTILPVVDDEEKFLGIITQDDLIVYLASSFSFKEPGAIIVIETSKRGYSLSEIARIVELENISVLASFITELPDSQMVLLTLKFNSSETGAVISALERYDYNIKASFTEEEYTDDLKDRYDQLMNYLNV